MLSILTEYDTDSKIILTTSHSEQEIQKAFKKRALELKKEYGAPKDMIEEMNATKDYHNADEAYGLWEDNAFKIYPRGYEGIHETNLEIDNVDGVNDNTNQVWIAVKTYRAEGLHVTKSIIVCSNDESAKQTVEAWKQEGTKDNPEQDEIITADYFYCNID